MTKGILTITAGILTLAIMFGWSDYDSQVNAKGIDPITARFSNNNCIVTGPDGNQVTPTSPQDEIVIPHGSTLTGECFLVVETK